MTSVLCTICTKDYMRHMINMVLVEKSVGYYLRPLLKIQ